MTIRIRLTLLFGLIVSGLVLIFCLLIYFFARQYRKEEFQQRLRAEALTSVELLFGKETISPELFRLLDKNQVTVLSHEEIIIYDYQNKIVYESGNDYLDVSVQTLNRVRLEKEIYWRTDNREIVGIAYTDPINRFVVFASAVDQYGFSKLRNLAFLLSTGWLLMSGLVFVAGWFYAGRSLHPIQRIISGVDEITASRLDLRLPEGTKQDELMQLSHRFNQMLDRIEEAFQIQRSFVSHASHELRTPLTAITGQIQVALLARDEPEQLYEMLQSVLDDVKEMNRLTNGLLALASLNMDEKTHEFTPVALDELLWQVRSELLKTHADYSVHVFSESTHSHWNVYASEVLLRTALVNLMENGCKFSPDRAVSVLLKSEPDCFLISFHTQGAFIPADELPQIFKPFQRGSNARHVRGHGIGLSLTDRIIRQHRGRLTVESDEQTGTLFTVALPV